MAAPLSEVVSILLRESHTKPTATKGGGGAAKIPLGNIAVAMFDCLRAMHDNGNLFIDVKPENFMLASSSSSSTSLSTSNNKKKEVSSSSSVVSSRIRLIDFGLVERYGDMSTSKHREDMYPDAMLVGTPTYASLNVMEGHTPSRRDDLEALGYVICELILMLASSSSSVPAASSSSKRKTAKEEDVHILPWSTATSDSELKVIKAREMDTSQRLKSKLFQCLKSVGSDSVMNTYFAMVRGLGYSETPDYDVIRGMLIKLVVTTITEAENVTSGSSGRATTKQKKEKTTTKSPVGRRQSGRRKHDEEEEEEDDDDDNSDDSVKIIDENAINRGKKMQKFSKSTMTSGGVRTNSVARRAATSKGTTPATREISTQTDNTIDDNTSMDWEPVDDTAASDSDDVDVEKGKGVLKLCITDGPHVGHEIPFGGNLLGTVCVGKDPASRAMKDVIKFAIAKDSRASSVHAKFVINSKSKVSSVKVFDMASTGHITSVNGTALPSGKSRQAFVGDKIMCGESVFEIRKV
jgi:casein kinase I family protein HRR25